MNKEDFKKIAYPETYADEIELHNIFSYMRREEPVSWVEPDQFEAWKEMGLELGFGVVESGPLVRSSYHAESQAAALTSG